MSGKNWVIPRILQGFHCGGGERSEDAEFVKNNPKYGLVNNENF